MSKRTEGLADQVISLQGELDDARREVAEVSGANGRLAAQLSERDLTITSLIQENATLTAALSARTDDETAGFPT